MHIMQRQLTIRFIFKSFEPLPLSFANFFFSENPPRKISLVTSWQTKVIWSSKESKEPEKWRVNYISSVMLESERAVTERLVVLTLLEGLALVVGVVLTSLVELLQEGQVGGVPWHQTFLVQQCQDTDVRLKTESHTVYLE